MIGNPLALLGLLAVAVPILIHLLGRYRSRIERFPTLRFIGTSRLNPTTRRRINDWPLLLVRIAIVAAAAFALSQPLFHRAPSTSSDLTRVVIVDTSASVSRAIADTFTGTHVATASLDDAIPGAVAWLSTRPGRREIVIVSDFQRSSIDTTTLASIPRDIGVILSREAARDLLLSNKQIPRRFAAQDDIGTFAGAADLPGGDAAWRAIGLPRPPERPNARIAIIYRKYPGADSLLRNSTAVDSMWMARIVASLRRDAALTTAGRSMLLPPNDRADLEHVTPGILAAKQDGRLLIFVREDAGSLLSAALNQALVRAISPPPPGAELDTRTWSQAELAKWQRAPTASPSRATDASDARWIWALCLALIGIETWVRSRSRQDALNARTPVHPDARTGIAA